MGEDAMDSLTIATSGTRDVRKGRFGLRRPHGDELFKNMSERDLRHNRAGESLPLVDAGVS